MAITRRNLILGIGGGVALVAAGGLWRVTRMPGSAVRPWDLAPPPPADVRLDALRHAILAPNPHNRQPWLLRLDGTDGVTVFCDLAKRLPMTDPYDRQITIGFGTFVELARIAATARGVSVEVTPFPDGAPEIPARLDARPVARLRFVADPSVRRDPLLDAVTLRRTTREKFDAAPTPAQVATLSEPLDGVLRTATADPAKLAAIRAITVAATMVENTTQRTWMESVNLMRIGATEIDAQPDGLFLEGPMAEAGSAAHLLTRSALADQNSSIYTTGLDQQRALSESLPGAVWITTPANTRADHLRAGAAYMRTTLAAQALGLKMHPQSQALQEYPEMIEHYAAIQALLGAGGAARVQMLARLGTGPVVGPAPRWPLERHMIA
jgi:hypothetical protein